MIIIVNPPLNTLLVIFATLIISCVETTQNEESKETITENPSTINEVNSNNNEVFTSYNTFEDPRDGKNYKTITLGKLTWFAENLNYAMEGAYSYDNNEQNSAKYGRLYKWEVALKACPDGWHLSTEYDWQYTEEKLGMDFRELMYTRNRGMDEGGKMKAGGTSGMEVLYGGWRRKDGTFSALGENAAFWTSTEADMDHAWHRDIDTGDDFIYRSRVVKSYGLSCRCVKNYQVKDVKEEE